MLYQAILYRVLHEIGSWVFPSYEIDTTASRVSPTAKRSREAWTNAEQCDPRDARAWADGKRKVGRAVQNEALAGADW
jgi:hypothetical protein